MKNNSPQNFSCEFASETIDYIYGEINIERKNAFRIHLNNCAGCAEEIRGFSDIKLSIQNWKTSEFDRMATPKIEIPYAKVNRIVLTTERLSIFDSVKSYFRLSPVLSGAAAFVFLAFLLGSAFFILRNDKSDLVAETNIKDNLSPTPNIARDNSDSGNTNFSAKPKNIENDNPADENPSPVITDDKTGNNSEKNTPAKASDKSVIERKSQTIRTTEKKSPVTENINKNTDQKAVQPQKKTRLNDLPEEDEDNSLRLSDMFAELDTK